MTKNAAPKSASKDVLVLITTDYPADKGDASFVRNEIDELASRFNLVFLFSFRPVEGPMVDLPSNVLYAGALTDAPRMAGVRGLLDPRRLLLAAKSVGREIRGGEMTRNPDLALGNVFTGTRFAQKIEDTLATHGVTVRDRVCVYSFWASHGVLALPYLVRRPRTTMRLHRFDLYADDNPHLPLRASLFKAADAVVPISEDGRKYLLGTYNPRTLDPRKVKVARLGTRDQGEGPSAERDAGEKPRSASSPIRVVSCSSVIPVKRVASILPALEILSEDRMVHWVHFGAGNMEDSLRRDARDAMDRHSNLIVDLPGWTPHDKVLQYYRDHSVDAFVNVSDSEGVPVSIMEALSFGIPVVATDVGGSGEIVGQALGSGVLIPKRPSADTLAAALTTVVDNRGQFAPREVWLRMSDANVTAGTIADIVTGGRR